MLMNNSFLGTKCQMTSLFPGMVLSKATLNSAAKHLRLSNFFSVFSSCPHFFSGCCWPFALYTFPLGSSSILMASDPSSNPLLDPFSFTPSCHPPLLSSSPWCSYHYFRTQPVHTYLNGENGLNRPIESYHFTNLLSWRRSLYIT